MVLVFGALIIYAGCYSLFVYGSIRVSKVIHKQLVSTVLGTTLRWLDKTPTSRIIARCTADIQYGELQTPRSLICGTNLTPT